jgi:hypothetical protein
MSTPLPHNFFVIRDAGATDAIERVTLTQPLQQQLTTLFSGQRTEFFTPETEEIAFNGDALTADPGELLTVPNFPLPPPIMSAVTNSGAVPPLVFTSEAAYAIQCIFAITPTADGEILFQAFDRRRVLADQASRFAIVHSEGTFRRLESPGLILDAQLAALYRGGTLYFRSYQVAKRIFDLTAYYREASNDEITTFLGAGLVACAAPAMLLANIDTVGRKKFTMVRTSGVLDTVSLKTIVSTAKRHKVPLTTQVVNGQRKIVFPSERKELKAVLSFLNQDIYEAPLTRDGRFLSRSKTRISD